MAAGPGSRDGDFQVQGSRVGNNRSLRAVCEGSCQVGLNRKIGKLVIRERAAHCAVKDDISLAQLEQVAEMPAADRAESRNQDLQPSPNG